MKSPRKVFLSSVLPDELKVKLIISNTKIQTGGLRMWNFQRYSRMSMWKFQGPIKKEVEFPGVIKIKSWGISMMGFGFWPWNLQGQGITQFCRAFRGKALFSLEFPRAKWQIYCGHTIITTIIRLLSLLYNLIQQSLNSGSMQVQILLTVVGDLRWWGSLTMVQARNKAKHLNTFCWSTIPQEQFIIIIIIIILT